MPSRQNAVRPVRLYDSGKEVGQAFQPDRLESLTDSRIFRAVVTRGGQGQRGTETGTQLDLTACHAPPDSGGGQAGPRVLARNPCPEAGPTPGRTDLSCIRTVAPRSAGVVSSPDIICFGPTTPAHPKLCQTSSGIVPRMRLPRTRFCRVPSLITICEAIPPPAIAKSLKTGRIRSIILTAHTRSPARCDRVRQWSSWSAMVWSC